MNRRFLGDALDFWKGGLLQRLTAKGLLKDLRVDPCWSDAGPWGESDLALYANLLGVEAELIRPHDATIQGNRSRYFGNATCTGDLFLDPDTGVQTGKVKAAYAYVTPQELSTLATCTPSRVLVVYQHVSRCKIRDRVQTIVKAIRQADENQCCCSAEFTMVAMLFVSHDQGRITAIHAYLKELFGDKAADRVTLWERT